MDYTSALYLGLRHRHVGCRSPLTTGKPLSLESKLERRVAAEMVSWLGSEEVLIGPSTLHLAFDLFASFDPAEWSLFIDRDSYPILQWGSGQLIERGMRSWPFTATDPASLRRSLSRHLRAGRKPLVITDGWNFHTDRLNPLRHLLSWTRTYQGLLIVDDSQCLGLLGARPTALTPWGRGGAGSLAFHGLAGAKDCLIIASLAKGLGVPVAQLAGPKQIVQRVRRLGKTRMHTSPPSNPELLAAHHAIRINRSAGDALRRKLQRNIALFQRLTNRIGLPVSGGLFPYQRIECKQGCRDIHRRLQRQGIETLLLRGQGAGPRLGILLRADHRAVEIHSLVHQLGSLLDESPATVQETRPDSSKSYVDIQYSAFSFARNC